MWSAHIHCGHRVGHPVKRFVADICAVRFNEATKKLGSILCFDDMEFAHVQIQMQMVAQEIPDVWHQRKQPFLVGTDYE